MKKESEKRSGKDRREKSDKRSESMIKYFIPEDDEKRTKKDRRKSKKDAEKKK